jgi:hypothetical protein
MYVLTVRGVHGPINMSQIHDKLDTVSKPFELSPERGRYILTYSLAERKSFALDKELATAANPDVGYYKGKYYIYFAPGVSVLALPLYNLGKLYNIPQVGAFFTISLFAALNIVLVYILSRKLLGAHTIPAVIAALIFGFASTSWSYAITMYQHHVTTFLILSSFLAVWAGSHHKKYSILTSIYVWAAFGLALFVDYPNAILLLPVLCYFLYSYLSIKQEEKNITFSYSIIPIIASIIFFALVGLHGYYNNYHFDSPTRLSGSLVGFDNLNAKSVKKDDISEEAISDLANQKDEQSYFKEKDLPRGFATLTGSTDRGLLFYSPIFILALYGIRYGLKKFNTQQFFLLSTVFANLFLYSSWGDPWGGWAFGPRYLIPTMAILAMYIGLWLTKTKWYYTSRFSTYILFVISCAISLMGVLTTNQVPPKVEGLFLKLKYNYLLNLEYMSRNISSSYLYNNYVSYYMTVQEYYLLLLGVIAALVFIIIFIIPGFTRNHED